MIKMHLNSIRSDLLCTGPHSGACEESRPQPTSQIDDVTVLLNVFSFISLFFENLRRSGLAVCRSGRASDRCSNMQLSPQKRMGGARYLRNIAPLSINTFISLQQATGQP